MLWLALELRVSLFLNEIEIVGECGSSSPRASLRLHVFLACLLLQTVHVYLCLPLSKNNTDHSLLNGLHELGLGGNERRASAAAAIAAAPLPSATAAADTASAVVQSPSPSTAAAAATAAAISTTTVAAVAAAPSEPPAVRALLSRQTVWNVLCSVCSIHPTVSLTAALNRSLPVCMLLARSRMRSAGMLHRLQP